MPTSVFNSPWFGSIRMYCNGIIFRKFIISKNENHFSYKSKIQKTTKLTLSWRRPISYRNQSIDFRSKSMDWFLYYIGLRHERVNHQVQINKPDLKRIFTALLVEWRNVRVLAHMSLVASNVLGGWRCVY